MVIIGHGTGDAHITQTTLASEPGPTTLLVINFDDSEPTATNTYYITQTSAYVPEYCCEIIPDDEPVGTTLVLITLPGYLRTPIEYLRQSMHPV